MTIIRKERQTKIGGSRKTTIGWKERPSPGLEMEATVSRKLGTRCVIWLENKGREGLEIRTVSIVLTSIRTISNKLLRSSSVVLSKYSSTVSSTVVSSKLRGSDKLITSPQLHKSGLEVIVWTGVTNKIPLSQTLKDTPYPKWSLVTLWKNSSGFRVPFSTTLLNLNQVISLIIRAFYIFLFDP